MISPGSGLLPQSLTARNCVAVSATARRAMSSNHVPTMRTTHHRGDLPPAVGTGLAAGRPCGSQPGSHPVQTLPDGLTTKSGICRGDRLSARLPRTPCPCRGVKESPVPPGRVRRPAYIGISQWVLAIRAERGRLRYADLDVGIPRALAPPTPTWRADSGLETPTGG